MANAMTLRQLNGCPAKSCALAYKKRGPMHNSPRFLHYSIPLESLFMSSTIKSSLPDPRTKPPKPDDYYNKFPSTFSYDGHNWEETFNTAGRMCESENHPGFAHGPLPTSSSLKDSAKCSYKRYRGGRVVDRFTTNCWHLAPLVKIFGHPTLGSSFAPHVVGSVKSEAADTIGAMAYRHDVAVALSEARLRENPKDSDALAVVSKHNRYGGRIGPEDWFVYTRVESEEGDPERHIISEDGLILSQATFEEPSECLEDDENDTVSVTASESTLIGWELVYK